MNQGQQQNDFVEGLFVNYQQTQFGTIVKQSFHRERFIAWLNQQQTSEKGYVNVDIMTARESGKPYAKLNTFVPQPQNQQPMQQQQPQYQQQPQPQYQQPIQQQPIQQQPQQGVQINPNDYQNGMVQDGTGM